MRLFIANVFVVLVWPFLASADSAGSVQPGTPGTESFLSGCIYNAAGVSATSGQQMGLQCTNSGQLLTNGTTTLNAGSATIGSIANTGFNITGALPGFSSPPTVTIGGGSVSITGPVTTIGSFSNASSSVLPTSANSGGVSFLYGYNGASWDQLQVDGGKNLMVNCVVGCFSGSLTSGAATIGSIANTGFNVTGTLPAFASIPTVNIGSGSVSVSGAVAQTGAWTTSVTQSNAANLTATVVGTGTFAVQATGNVGGLTGVGQSGSLTRPANTTTYGAGGKAVCASISNNCAPLQVTIAGATSATGTGANVIMLKSGSSTLNAGFNIYFYSAMPTVAGVHDASAYLGPYAADVPYLVGIYSCATPILTNDGTPQVFFRCASTSPTGWEQYQTVAGQRFVYAMISVTGPYAPASAETFTIYANSYQDK